MHVCIHICMYKSNLLKYTGCIFMLTFFLFGLLRVFKLKSYNLIRQIAAINIESPCGVYFHSTWFYASFTNTYIHINTQDLHFLLIYKPTKELQKFSLDTEIAFCMAVLRNATSCCMILQTFVFGLYITLFVLVVFQSSLALLRKFRKYGSFQKEIE